MRELEIVLVMMLAAVVLAGAARRVGAPYPVFLALGGAFLAFMPGMPSFALPPELALALFIAPVLLDAAYDASPRDLRDNWVPVASLVVIAVSLTTAAVALVLLALAGVYSKVDLRTGKPLFQEGVSGMNPYYPRGVLQS